MKKFVKWLCLIFSIAIVAIILWFAFAFLGNPVSWTVARINTSRYLEKNFGDSHFQVNKVGYNFKTGSYYAFIDSPASQDSYFTVYFDGWGRYKYDTYENVVDKTTTLSRLDEQYRTLVKTGFPYDNGKFDVSIVFGELRVARITEIYTYTDENGNTKEYTLDKNYGFDRSLLELDKEYDIAQIGRDCGSICLYIHDPEVTVERAAELLLEVKAYLDEMGIPFHAIDFNLCEPRNENGQMVGEQITLFDFLYSDIYGDGLVDRVREHWEIAKEHHAVQDGLKSKPSFINEE